MSKSLVLAPRSCTHLATRLTGISFKTWTTGTLCLASCTFAWDRCSYESTELHYVGSIVQREQAEYTVADKQICRISIIKKLTRVFLEEMKPSYPLLEPSGRPGG